MPEKTLGEGGSDHRKIGGAHAQPTVQIAAALHVINIDGQDLPSGSSSRTHPRKVA